MTVTFGEAINQTQLTVGEHKDRIGELGIKLAQVQHRAPAEIEETWARDRAIMYGLGKSSPENIKVPDNVVLTAAELELAAWISEYATQQNLPFKEAMAHVFEYLKRDPKWLACYTNDNASFAEMPSGDDVHFPIENPTEFDCSLRALGHLRRIHLYQAISGCDFAEAVGAVI